MKYLFISVSIFIFNTSKAQDDSILISKPTDSSLYKKMSSVKLYKYEGKSINRFLKNKLFKSFLVQTYSDGGRIGVLNAVVLEYGRYTSVFIKVKSFKHVNQVDKFRKWDFNLVKKEKIESIEIFIEQPDCNLFPAECLRTKAQG